MTAAETIAEKLLAEVITVGMLRQTMDAENVDMRTAANMWKASRKLFKCSVWAIVRSRTKVQ